jgi:hypothetical protein
LATRDDAAPYVRMELAATTDKFVARDLAEALRELDARAFERNKARLAWWATTRRFDLCAEVLVACPTDPEAVPLVDQVIRAGRELGVEAAGLLGLPFEEERGMRLPLPMRLLRPFSDPHVREYAQISGAEVTVTKRQTLPNQILLRAGTCELDYFNTYRWMAAVRSGLSYPAGSSGNEWHDSIVVVNDSMPLYQAHSSVIICDGDVELRTQGRFHSVIIANGSIRSAKEPWGLFNSGDNCLLAAAEDIMLSELRGDAEGGSRAYAGGRVVLERKARPDAHAREGLKELPFGVRFVDPARDFGLALDAVKGGLKVSTLADWSPFAKYGVRAGDVVTRIGDVEPPTAVDFRRQLRRGIVAESVLLHLRRGDEKLTRIVFFDGIPLPSAPMPRAAG